MTPDISWRLQRWTSSPHAMSCSCCKPHPQHGKYGTLKQLLLLRCSLSVWKESVSFFLWLIWAIGRWWMLWRTSCCCWAQMKVVSFSGTRSPGELPVFGCWRFPGFGQIAYHIIICHAKHLDSCHIVTRFQCTLSMCPRPQRLPHSVFFVDYHSSRSQLTKLRSLCATGLSRRLLQF